MPPAADVPQMAEKSSRNFITTNAVNNILSVPRKPASKYVDKETGATHDLEVLHNHQNNNNNNRN